MIFRVPATLAYTARRTISVVGSRSPKCTFSTIVSTTRAPPATSSFAQHWYNMFGSSTARYATFMAVGVILAEMGTNSATDLLWERNNEGKTYNQVDWSKFDEQEEEEEEEDDDDDDDDE
mmetsp:Transcript_35392/g.38302  ORF Transcript_35392/g.38302 Transcript_35392/m.38302 type:complete len:120 (-) Transcript_35392:236-595(-)